MSADEMEKFKTQADNVFSICYGIGQRKISYEQFANALETTYGTNIKKLALSIKIHCGLDLMGHLGFEIDENEDLVIQPLDEKDSAVRNDASAAAVSGSSRVGEAHRASLSESTLPSRLSQPSQRNDEIHVFDGDVSKLKPGMKVQIATGFVHQLPYIPTFEHQDEASRKMQYKAVGKFRKAVRKMTGFHEKMTEAMQLSGHIPSSTTQENDFI